MLLVTIKKKKKDNKKLSLRMLLRQYLLHPICNHWSLLQTTILRAPAVPQVLMSESSNATLRLSPDARCSSPAFLHVHSLLHSGIVLGLLFAASALRPPGGLPALHPGALVQCTEIPPLASTCILSDYTEEAQVCTA